MKFVIRFIRAIVYSNLWVCAAAVAYAAAHQIILQQSINFMYLGFLGLSTLSLYTSHRLVGYTLLFPDADTVKAKVYRDFTTPLCIGAAVALLASGCLYLLLDAPLRIYILAALPICVFYVLPLPVLKKRVRDLPYVKLFAIAIIWTWLCVLLPSPHMSLIKPWSILLSGLYLFGVTLPFDYRDIEVDSKQRVETIPQKLGFRSTRTLAILTLAIYTFGYAMISFKNEEFLPFALSGVSTISVLFIFHPRRGDLYYSFLLESCLMHPLIWAQIIMWFK